jgi:hypothetical protein
MHACRSIESFDHVLKDLRAGEEEDMDDPANSLRNMSEDMKRVMGALRTQESKVGCVKRGGSEPGVLLGGSSQEWQTSSFSSPHHFPLPNPSLLDAGRV